MVQEIQLKGLPFPIKSGQVFYVEKKENKQLNSFILTNYEWLRRIFKREGLQFIYIPVIGEELIRYNAPYYSDEQCKEVLTTLDFGLYLLPNDFPASLVFALSESLAAELKVCYIHIENHWYKSTKVIFEHLAKEIRVDRDNQFFREAREEEEQRLKEEKASGEFAVKNNAALVEDDEGECNYSRKSRNDGSSIRYSLRTDKKELYASYYDDELFYCYEDDSLEDIRFSRHIKEPKKTADETFDEESKKLIHEIQERVDALRNLGISTLFLHGLIDKGEKISRLRITKDKRIFLPDYNNMEISLPELPKAVFLLFLRHPEGIRFKELTDYRDEFRTIYLSLNPRGSREKNERSIREVTNPMNNSINEKCARIREAFVSKFDERLAEKYYITGKKGEPKKITLAPELIIWEA